MKNPVRTGTMIAVAVAGLFTAACKKSEQTSNTPSTTETKPATDDKAASDRSNMMNGGEKMAKVHCEGVNECKGKGGCKTAANACAGQNGCKGKGFTDVASEDECKSKGGTVMAKM